MRNIELVPKKRGRPKKIPDDTISNSSDAKNDKHEFNSYSFYQDLTTNFFGQPLLQAYTIEEINTLITDPIANNAEIRKISRHLYNQNGIVTNTIDYMVALPTLDSVVVSRSKDKSNKKAIESVRQALKIIRDKEFIRDALYRGMLDGIAFYYCETSGIVADKKKMMSDWDVQNITEINTIGTNLSMVSLPTDYCKIVGLKNSSYIVAFDLKYFQKYGSDKLERKLKKYPKEIRDGYLKWDSAKNENSWIILDNSKTLVHKIRSTIDEPWGRPIVLAAISDILYSDYFTDTKRNVLNEINNRIIYQTFPEGKEKGSSALTQPQQEKQHNSVRNAIMQKNNRGGTSFFSVAAGTIIKDLSTSVEIFDSKNEENLRDDISTDLGFGASLLNGSSSGNYSTQQHNLELISAEIFTWIESFAYEINKVLNANVVTDKTNNLEVVYLPCTFANKDKFVDQMKELYTLGHGSLQAWVASTGMSVDAYTALMNQEIEEGWDDKYLPHPTSFTISDSADKSNTGNNVGGRPENDKIATDNLNQSKTNGSNAQPKPSK